MGTNIRPELSEKNKYYISKHRYYELKHFCLQYPEWKKEYDSLNYYSKPIINNTYKSENHISNPTEKLALKSITLLNNINLIEEVSHQTDEFLSVYILKAVTEGYSYTYLKNVLDMPCGKDMYYDRYRKFFWILSNRKKG